MGPPVLIDTNILIDYVAGVKAAHAELALYRDRAVSVINRIELLVNAGDAEPRVREFLSRLHQIELTPAIADETVQVRRALRLKLPDAILLATAHVESRLFLTRNTRDFQPGRFVRIPYTL